MRNLLTEKVIRNDMNREKIAWLKLFSHEATNERRSMKYYIEQKVNIVVTQALTVKANAKEMCIN